MKKHAFTCEVGVPHVTIAVSGYRGPSPADGSREPWGGLVVDFTGWLIEQGFGGNDRSREWDYTGSIWVAHFVCRVDAVDAALAWLRERGCVPKTKRRQPKRKRA